MKFRIKPYKGKWCSRTTANRINDMFLSAVTPDRTKLHKEAEEFAELMIKQGLSRKSIQ